MKSLFTILLVCFSTVLFAQPCLPEGITFTTQEQIDNFQINYPNCIEIEGDVTIQSHNITNLYGLNTLSKIQGYLYIDSTILASFQGLNSLELVGEGLSISRNVDLENFTGLDNLAEVGGILNIEDTEIENFTGLSELYSVGGLMITHSGVKNFIGLEGLITVDGDLYLENCFALESLTGLENITSINGSLIFYMTSLKSLAGIDNIDYNTILYLYIFINDSLSDCSMKCICDYLANPIGDFVIEENATGCNSPEEVEEACLTGIDDISNHKEKFDLYPNPSDETINFRLRNSNLNYQFYIEIRNLDGQLIRNEKNIQSLSYTLNISDLKPGIYFYMIKEKGEIVQQGKIIKK